MAQSIQQFKLWERFRTRLMAFVVTGVIVLTILIGRLVQVQLLQGDDFYEKSQRVIRKVVALPAPRGEIFDRNYKNRENARYIVSNRANLNLVVIPSHFKREELLIRTGQLERSLNLPKDSLLDKVKNIRKRNEEIVLIENLRPADLTVMGDYYLNFSKFIIRQSTGRFYNLGEKTAHLTGFIGPPSKNDLAAGIRSYQYLGKNGLEAQYDDALRGEDGEIIQIKTARGDVEEQRVLKNFIPGNNLILTIDAEVQEAAWKSLGDKTGAVLALKPATGEVIAIVSKPDYDPNILVSPDRDERQKQLQAMRSVKAELNRAISTKYPAASTFKPLVGLAGMEENRFTPDTVYDCPGKFVLKSTYKGFPDSTYYCWNTHHRNNFMGAVAMSCSVYFYEAGYRIGAEPIIKYARYFRLDQKTGIDLPAEIKGFIPSPLWKEKQYNQRWFDGDTVNLSIGQGFIETTLAGLVNFYAAIATGGVVKQPHVVREIRFAENDQVKVKISPTTLYELPISGPTLEVVRKALRAVTTSGTTRGVLNYGNLIPVAGKTGTVQTRSNDRFNKKSQHAWYIGYGPFDGDLNDMIVVGVFVERGIGGAVGAAPVAKEVFAAWTKILKARKET